MLVSGKKVHSTLLLMRVSQDYPPVDYRVDGFIHCMMSLYVGEWQESTL